MAGPWEDYTKPDDVAALVTAEAQRQGVDPALALSVARQESGLRHGAVSPKGAVGVMQLMPGTARDLGVDPSDLAQNIRGGVSYLKTQVDTFKDPRLAAAAYNAGPDAVRKHGGVPPYAETQSYVDAVAPQGDSAPPWMDYAPAAKPAPARGTAAPGFPAPTVAAPKSQPKPAAPMTIGGTLKSLLTGGAEGAAPILDTLLQAGPLGMIHNAADTLGRVQDLLAGHPQATLSGGITPVASAVDRVGYKPKNTTEQYARSIGQMAPAALAPGSIPARIANVVVPGVTAEAAAQGTKALGGGDTAQTVARTLGGVAGGTMASLRPSPRVITAPAPDLAQVRAANNAQWAKVDASGYRFPQADVTSLASDARQMLDEAGPALYPKASSVVDRIETLANGGDLTPAQANRLRSQVSEKLLAPGSDEASLGSALKGRIDQMIDTAAGANQDLAAARQGYTQYVKMREVSDRLGDAALSQQAAGTGGNPNSVRQAIKPLVKNKGAQRIRNFTPDEAASAKSLVSGDAVQNAVRALSAFDPFHSRLAALIQGVAGVKTLGLSAATIPVGMAATAADKSMTSQKAQALLDLIARGGVKPAATAPLQLTHQAPDVMALAGLLSALPAMSAARPLPPQRKRSGSSASQR